MKKIGSILLAICMILSISGLFFAASASVGDLNGDGSVSLVDVIICAKYALRSDYAAAADLNSSGRVELADTQLLAKVVLGEMDITQVDVQVLSSTTTLQLHEKPACTTNKTLRVELAGGESESAQFTIYSNSRVYQNMRVDVSPLCDGLGNTIPAQQVKLYREYFTAVDYEWTVGKVDASDKEKTAYILFPLEYDDYNCVTTVPGENTAYQLDITATYDTPAGEYTGQITITHDAGQIILPVSVTVWDFDLPQTPTFRTLFGYWPWHTASYTGFTGEKLRQTILAAYDLAADYKISLSALPPVIASDSDPEAYASSIRRWIDENPTQTAFIIPFYHDSDDQGRWFVSPQSAQRNTDLYSALERYGVLDRGYIYANDEPSTDLQRYNMQVVGDYLIESGWNDKVHNIVPVTHMSEMQGPTNTWCPLTGTVDFDILEQVRQRTGAEMWWYYIIEGTCPGLDLEQDQSHMRIQGWFARQHDITGGLHWLMNMYGYYIDYAGAPVPPGYYFDDVNIYGIGNPCQLVQGLEGDGVLNREIVVPTMLMTSTRDSIEDYDYLVLLEQRVQDFLNETGIDMTLDEAMEAYYSGLAVAFDEFATSESPENIPVMRRHVAETVVNGADYILTQQTLPNNFRFNQKEFKVYVKPGVFADIPGAELLSAEHFDGYDVYTFLYTHTQVCEFFTVQVGTNSYIRPVQMYLGLTEAPVQMFTADSDVLTDCNDSDFSIQTVDGMDHITYSENGDGFYIPQTLFTDMDAILASTDMGVMLQTDVDCTIDVQLHTDRDSFTLISAQLWAGKTEIFFKELPHVLNGSKRPYTSISFYAYTEDQSPLNITITPVYVVKK